MADERSMFLPIRARSDGRYLCDYDPERQLLRFRRGDWEETIDLTECVPAERMMIGYARILAQFLEKIGDGGLRDGRAF